MIVVQNDICVSPYYIFTDAFVKFDYQLKLLIKSYILADDTAKRQILYCENNFEGAF